MFKFNSKLMAGAGLCALLLAGCGGDGDGKVVVITPTPPGPQTISSVVAYITDMIAGTSDTTEPTDINLLTLAADETSEPAPLQ
ncbi:MAG: hypothetical protein JWP96_514 [Polaromonas sp.]|nr:hypothetical protein [Polaromonas sp.]